MLVTYSITAIAAISVLISYLLLNVLLEKRRIYKLRELERKRRNR